MMTELKELPGFPMEIGGTKKFMKPGSWGDEQVHLTALGQHFEAAILDALGKYSGDIDRLIEVVWDAASSGAVGPYLETVHAARLCDAAFEVEYSAVGYPDRYIKAMHLDGPRGSYKVRRVAREASGITERHHWHRDTPGETSCVAEACDGDDRALSRVTVTLEFGMGTGSRSYDADSAFREVELFARRIAHELASTNNDVQSPHERRWPR